MGGWGEALPVGPWLHHPSQPRPPFYPAESPCPGTPTMAKGTQEEWGGRDSKGHERDLWGTCAPPPWAEVGYVQSSRMDPRSPLRPWPGPVRSCP